MFTDIKLEHFIDYYFMCGTQEHYSEVDKNISIKEADKLKIYGKEDFSSFSLICPTTKNSIVYYHNMKFCPFCGEKLK